MICITDKLIETIDRLAEDVITMGGAGAPESAVRAANRIRREIARAKRRSVGRAKRLRKSRRERHIDVHRLYYKDRLPPCEIAGRLGIKQRTVDCLIQRQIGNPYFGGRLIDERLVKRSYELAAGGMKRHDIAHHLGVSRATVQRYLVMAKHARKKT